jgi:uncharacterized protein
MDDSENIPVNPSIDGGVVTMDDLISARLSRRSALAGFAAFGLAGCTGTGNVTAPEKSVSGKSAGQNFNFPEIARAMDEKHHVAEGYSADILIRWGDPLFADSPAFDPHKQSAAAQRRQFGYNNDFIGYVPLARRGKTERALLCVNHEYTSTPLMLPGIKKDDPTSVTREYCEIEMAAHGGSIVEIQRQAGNWSVVVGSSFNRRITADSTPMEITGPAAGHPRLRTSADPEGRRVAGMMNNCAGGMTPWGTYLTAEENINLCFLGKLATDHPESANHKRMGVPGGSFQWGRHFDRFDVAKEPNEPNRFGWIVEIDPMDVGSMPKKRTALGRFKHEGCETVVAPDGRLVIYSGDDQRFEYVYKFVTKGRYNPKDRATNRDLLDEGTLYVARFDADGNVDWLPLIYGQGPLTEANGFASQGDVVIDARRAGDLLGATPMDRPEDVEPDAKSGRVWVMCTNNDRRKEAQVNAANPRADNKFGHIIEITEPGGDFTSTRSRWEILVRCGDPSDAAVGASWNPATSENGWFGSPDNCAVDPNGRLWVSTDGNDDTGSADGLWAVSTDGPERGTGKAFFRCPVGAELCGPRFSPSGESLFVAVQHPGDGPDPRGSSFENPSTRWPDFKDGMPPRPSVVVISKIGGGVIAS